MVKENQGTVSFYASVVMEPCLIKTDLRDEGGQISLQKPPSGITASC